MRRLARILSVTMITAGLVILADAAITLAWKEPLSSLYSSQRQGEAEAQLARIGQDFRETAHFARLDSSSGENERARDLARIYSNQIEDGRAMGRLTIPSIGADYTVVEGTDSGDLQKGPGHYPDTSLPGQGRTVAIAGHRTTYGAPFKQIDAIDAEDELVVEMPYGVFTYTVSKTRIVEPTDVQVVDDIGSEQLVLTACHPLYSAAQRYVVFADLTDTGLVPSSL
jgi:sortase A